ncbi:hypothetical protein D0862_13639 [Hortaea werneckii]|uniref:Uncharacterized protein n=1 Tax=Hortaea werneckii TaxID=91943 RepID=A0A3M7EK38_HORWE|nr:hypothetical protein D0862_13639 [Hortaea werneckii]
MDDRASEPGPYIIHISSLRSHQSDPNQEGYASSKAGQLWLMHSTAISLQRFGIRVNLVAPGRIKVAHESQGGDDKGLEPENIADAVEYLVKAEFVTGQGATVDGGATRVKKKS